MEQYNENNRIKNSYDTESIFYLSEGSIQEIELQKKTENSQLEKIIVKTAE